MSKRYRLFVTLDLGEMEVPARDESHAREHLTGFIKEEVSRRLDEFVDWDAIEEVTDG